MKIQENPYPLRVDKALLKKLKFIANENGRSINKEIEVLIKQYVFDYEKKNGSIVISDDE